MTQIADEFALHGVVGEKDKPVGMITYTDVLREFVGRNQLH